MNDSLDGRLASGYAVADALDRALDARDLSGAGTLVAALRDAIDSAERAAVLVVVSDGATPRQQETASRQHLAMVALAALHERALPLLKSRLLDGIHETGVRRFPARVPPDAVAAFRSAATGFVDVSGARLSGLLLEHADLSFARLDGATLHAVDARSANLEHSIAIKTHLESTNLAYSTMTASNFKACLATDSNFVGSYMHGAQWHDTTAVRCLFNRGVLTDLRADRAVFIDCDFRGADFSVLLQRRATMTGACFVRCDLRGTHWSNRSLTGVTFEQCKVHGVTGRPFIKGLTIVDPDLSVEGDGSRIGRTGDVMDLWSDPSNLSTAPARARYE